MTKDPVCGMTLQDGAAKATEVYDGRVYQFCSHGCHAKFKANPAAYAGED